jgi:hypothetical protein
MLHNNFTSCNQELKHDEKCLEATSQRGMVRSDGGLELCFRLSLEASWETCFKGENEICDEL